MFIQTVGVKQGDCLAPVLFLFIIMDFAKLLEKEWDKENLTKATFHHKQNSPCETGKILGHSPGKFSKGLFFQIFTILYVEYRAFIFERRDQIERVTNFNSPHLQPLWPGDAHWPRQHCIQDQFFFLRDSSLEKN